MDVGSATIFWTVGLFVLGACIGSFLNVVIYRLPAGLSIVWPPSHCWKCFKPIAWYDNLPILSYFILRGRCRNCGDTFSVQYAVFEAFTGLLFAFYYWAYFVWQVRGPEQSHWDVYAAHMALLAALLASSAIDFRYKEIFSAIPNGGMVLAVALSAGLPNLQAHTTAPHMFTNVHLQAAVLSLLGLIVGGGVIWLTAILGKLFLRREAMGFGDVLLMGMIGAVLGWPAALFTFFLAPMVGLVYAVWHYLRHHDREVPYGPFLSLAAAVVMLVQGPLEAWFAPGMQGLWQLIFGS